MNHGPASPGASALASAIDWLLGVFLGPVATAIAVIAVATIGFLALSGRVDFRRAMRVILGCFILFGASSIAAAIQSAAGQFGQVAEPSRASPAPRPPIPVLRPPEPQQAYDPYAGAAVAPH